MRLLAPILALATGIAVLGTALAPATVDAQALRVTPRIGIYLPMTDLGEQTREGVARAAALDNSLALGLGLELGLPMLPFNLRANLDYATETAVTEEGLDHEAARTTVLAATADLVLRPRRLLVVQPYLFVGGGLKQYAFDSTDPGAFRDSSDPTLHLGGGLDVGLRSLSLTAQLSDYISWYELREGDGQIQHDLFLTVGLSFGLF
jgi:hypothetical protein